jgi:hypothetical protein
METQTPEKQISEKQKTTAILKIIWKRKSKDYICIAPIQYGRRDV